jgi:hypothetical protein
MMMMIIIIVIIIIIIIITIELWIIGNHKLTHRKLLTKNRIERRRRRIAKAVGEHVYTGRDDHDDDCTHIRMMMMMIMMRMRMRMMTMIVRLMMMMLLLLMMMNYGYVKNYTSSPFVMIYLADEIKSMVTKNAGLDKSTVTEYTTGKYDNVAVM